jgi:hypothetical protein
MCGRSTFSSIRPPTGTTSSCCTLWTSSPVKRSRSSVTAGSTLINRQRARAAGTRPRDRARVLRCDNGPGMTANAIRDWCRFSRAGSAYIQPGSPWQNPCVESFGGRVRDELLAVELFSCLTEARVLIEDWRQDYNHRRPHSALGMTTAVAFAPTGCRPTSCRARQRRTPPPLRVGSVRPGGSLTPEGTHYPPALTAGGPMNGLRSDALRSLLDSPVRAASQNSHLRNLNVFARHTCLGRSRAPSMVSTRSEGSQLQVRQNPIGELHDLEPAVLAAEPEVRGTTSRDESDLRIHPIRRAVPVGYPRR